MPEVLGTDGEPEILDLAIVEELKQAWGENVPRFSATDEGLKAEFLTKVYEYARQWLIEREGPVSGAPPCVFVQSRSVTEQSVDLSASALPYFASTPEEEVGGRVFLANDDLSVVCEVQGAPFSKVSDVAKTLSDLGLDDHMHALFRLDRGELIVCEKGLTGGNRRVVVRLGASNRLSPLQLEQEIWRFHRQFTQTPSGILISWRGAAANRVTSEKLERQISAMLAFYFALTVGAENVTMEHFTPHGRIDVQISRHGMDAAAGACVMELKVLRSRIYSGRAESGWTTVSPKDMIEHASEGVMQAVEYLEDERAGTAYLLCFDARLDDEDQPDVLVLAVQHQVCVRRYFMYDSPKSARQARMAAASAGTKLSGEP